MSCKIGTVPTLVFEELGRIYRYKKGVRFRIAPSHIAFCLSLSILDVGLAIQKLQELGLIRRHMEDGDRVPWYMIDEEAVSAIVQYDADAFEKRVDQLHEELEIYYQTTILPEEWLLCDRIAQITKESQDSQSKHSMMLRANDGHRVCSLDELAIDNWLDRTGIVHSYLQEALISGNPDSCFYIPAGNVYIELLDMDFNSKSTRLKMAKIGLCHKLSVSLITITSEDIAFLDDILPKKLLKYGITTS